MATETQTNNRPTLKILHIVTMFPRNESDYGIAPWLVGYLQQLESMGVHNVVLAPSYRGLGNQVVRGIEVKRFRYFFRRFENLTHEVNAVTRIRQNPLYFFCVPFLIIAGYFATRRLIRENDFDIVQIHWPFPMVLVGLAAFGHIPVILKFYSAELALLKKARIFKPVVKWLAKRSASLFANSTFTAKMIEQELGCKAQVVYDGYIFPEVPPEISLPDASRAKEILFVGRLVERKGVEYLLRALRIVYPKIDVRLTVVGTGPLFPALKALTVELGLEDRVNFTGALPQQELEKAYRRCDLFVLPACYDSSGDTEGLGVVLLEALSCGKPVIGSNVGGIPDIIKHEQTGLLVPEKDPEALAQAIERVLSDPSLYFSLAKNGFEYAKNTFSIQSIARRGKELYLTILSAKDRK